MEREGKPELHLEAPRRLQLRRRVVDADRTRPTPGEPGRDVRRPAAELDRIDAGQIGRQHADPRFGDVEDAPADLVAGPVPATTLDVVGGHTVPGRAVLGDMIAVRGYRALVHVPLSARGNVRRAGMIHPQNGSGHEYGRSRTGVAIRAKTSRGLARCRRSSR